MKKVDDPDMPAQTLWWTDLFLPYPLAQILRWMKQMLQKVAHFVMKCIALSARLWYNIKEKIPGPDGFKAKNKR